MDRLFDSLSEDWISEPRSSHSISIRKDSPAPSNLSQQSSVSQSRIPRYNYRSASIVGASDLASTKRRSSGPIDEEPKNALSEKSSSYINASHNQVNGLLKTENSPEPRPTNKRHISTSSPYPTLQHTVQHKPSRPSPAKSSNKQDTPDWKRRLVQGNVAPGEQCNLFSPIGLENVFRPPTVKTNEKPHWSAKIHPHGVEGFRSSPPPYPAAENLISAARLKDSKQVQHPQQTRLTKGIKVEKTDGLRATLQKGNAPNVEAKEGIRSKQRSDIANSLKPALSSPSFHSLRRPASRKSSGLEGQAVESKGALSPNAHLPSLHNGNAGLIKRSSYSEQNRNSDDQAQDRAEIISPLYVSLHHTMDGHFDYAALDLSQSQVRVQIDQAWSQLRNLPSSPLSDNGVGLAEAKSPSGLLLPDSENHEWTSHSLPDDLSMGTDAFVANGGFINVKRGGYSNDGSFQTRALSPSSIPPFNASNMRSSTSIGSVIHCEKTGDAPFRSTPIKPLAPTTPNRHGTGDSGSQKQTGSSGSPLKLFEKYDTFTNERLSRRMSKFEEDMSQFTDHNGREVSKIKRRSHSQRQGSFEIKPEQSNKRISSFGQGMLDHHKFSSHQPPKSGLEPGQDDQKDHSRTYSLLDPSVYSIFQDSSLKDLSNGKSRLPSQKPSPAISHRRDRLLSEDASLFAPIGSESQKENLRNAHGKRLPRSPAKDTQPKRRRTLRCLEDLDDGNHQLQEEPNTLLATSMGGRKRKDALYDGQNQAADPEVLATRMILRPRMSTNNYKICESRKAGGDIAEEVGIGKTKTLKGQRLNHDQVDVETPTKALAEELATFTLNMTQEIANGSRKVSVTTADFFNEAEQIMQLIRAQARPQSSHMSFEDAQPNHQENWADSLVEESTRDEFSRPPSREGASLRKMREPAQVDARVISHLRKFEEKDDFELALSSSLKSLRVKQPSPPLHPCNSQIVEFESDELESDPPNLRIVNSQIHPEGQKFSLAENSSTTTSNNKFRSIASQSASDPSTGRSLNTGSSRGSKNKAVIAPETISHLLSDQVAGMRYDQEKQVWVKFSASSTKGSLKAHSGTASEMTEDLLAEIPDLSVDELEEMQRIKDAVSSLKSMGSLSKGISNIDHAKLAKAQNKQPLDDEIYDPRPRTAETATTASQEDSSAPSKYSRFASSGPIPETRATSWGDDILNKNPMVETTNYIRASENSHDNHDDHDDEVEHEISILEGRISTTPTRLDRRACQPRVVTVAFSSPLVDPIQTPNQSNFGPETWHDESDLDLDDSPVHLSSQPTASSTKRRSASFMRKSNYRSASRRVSIGNQSFVARPMSRLDEQDEISFLQSSNRCRDARMDVIVSTPLPTQGMMVPNPSSTSFQSSVGFHLSPLADFTMHQTDKSFNGIRDVTRRCGLMPRHEVEDKFSLATQALVKQLTDLEPYEPYWDFIRSMDLRDRGLVTLHSLDEFCGRTEELDVSDNSLEQLDGAPSTIRDLRICRNQLTDLTAWGHLFNLQYLDVSRNHIQSLKGFQGLIHLRELKADDNQIESLEGIHELDGLISLSLRGNCVGSVDFETFNL